MGQHKKSDHAARKKKYDGQKARVEANRRARWKKHLKKHPNYIAGMEKLKEVLQ